MSFFFTKSEEHPTIHFSQSGKIALQQLLNTDRKILNFMEHKHFAKRCYLTKPVELFLFFSQFGIERKKSQYAKIELLNIASLLITYCK